MTEKNDNPASFYMVRSPLINILDRWPIRTVCHDSKFPSKFAKVWWLWPNPWAFEKEPLCFWFCRTNKKSLFHRFLASNSTAFFTAWLIKRIFFSLTFFLIPRFIPNIAWKFCPVDDIRSIVYAWDWGNEWLLLFFPFCSALYFYIIQYYDCAIVNWAHLILVYTNNSLFFDNYKSRQGIYAKKNHGLLILEGSSCDRK